MGDAFRRGRRADRDCGLAEEGMLITLSRQYLAGAAPVASRVADALGWEVVDDAFIDAIAEKSGYSPEDVRSLEESVPSFLERFAQSSALSFPEFLVSAPNALEEPDAVKLAHRHARVHRGHRPPGPDRTGRACGGGDPGAGPRRAPRAPRRESRPSHRDRRDRALCERARGGGDRRRARRESRPLPLRDVRPRLERPAQLPHGAEHGVARPGGRGQTS